MIAVLSWRSCLCHDGEKLKAIVDINGSCWVKYQVCRCGSPLKKNRSLGVFLLMKNFSLRRKKTRCEGDGLVMRCSVLGGMVPARTYTWGREQIGNWRNEPENSTWKFHFITVTLSLDLGTITWFSSWSSVCLRTASLHLYRLPTPDCDLKACVASAGNISERAMLQVPALDEVCWAAWAIDLCVWAQTEGLFRTPGVNGFRLHLP